ncbi:MAG: methyltransferase domain-containing protein [Solirubrobacteraceae bacterium]
MAETEPSDPEALRAELLERWERAASGWGRRAPHLRGFGMPVSVWMIEHAGLQPGQRVLELAAGPGETGLLAAELIRPGGMLISSDASENMLELARGRAGELGIDNVEFKQLELEWIDLPTASVNVVMIRWGVMLTVDPEAALRETRRVLVPGGRIVLAVWDQPELNPWVTITDRVLAELGHTPPPDPSAPGMFALAAPGRLHELLEAAGFLEVVVESLELPRAAMTARELIAERVDLSRQFADTYERLSDAERAGIERQIVALGAPYADADGLLVLPGRSLVAAATA